MWREPPCGLPEAVTLESPVCVQPAFHPLPPFHPPDSKLSEAKTAIENVVVEVEVDVVVVVVVVVVEVVEVVVVEVVEVEVVVVEVVDVSPGRQQQVSDWGPPTHVASPPASWTSP